MEEIRKKMENEKMKDSLIYKEEIKNFLKFQ